MPDKKLLEDYPLYRKLAGHFLRQLDNLGSPAIHMYCDTCSSDQTFTMRNEFHEGFQFANITSDGKACHCRYVCTSCNRFMRHFWVQFGPEGKWVMKVGQWPAWEIAPDAMLE